MVHKAYSPSKGVVEVTFELPDSVWASRVYLTGDFTKEHASKTPMLQGRDGAWRVTVDLPIGNRYKYRYLIDERWYTEWNAENAITHKIDPYFSILDLTPSI